MSASIRDVAKRAGVSISTASRALNNKPDVNKGVRARILAAAQELDYAANLHARVMGGGRSRTLGLIISNSADPFFAALARGVSDAATSGGYSLIVWNTDEAIDRELWAHQMLRERRVDGALLASMQSGEAPPLPSLGGGDSICPAQPLPRPLSGKLRPARLSERRA